MTNDLIQAPQCKCETPPSDFLDDWSNIKIKVDASLKQVCTADKFLLKNNASERAITHRLGIFLGTSFAEWTIDCEYNRIGNLDQAKIQPRDELCYALDATAKIHGMTDQVERARKELKCGDNTDDAVPNRRAFPDLIVHKRGCELHNLLLIEVKTSGTAHWKTLIDLAKLHSFTHHVRRVVDSKNFEYPRYRFGLYIEFDSEQVTKQILFEKGAPVKS